MKIRLWMIVLGIAVLFSCKKDNSGSNGGCNSGCNNGEVKSGKSTKTEMEQTEENHERMAAAYPPPQLTTSLERKNLVRRLERVNQNNLISYIYLISQTGKVMAFYTVDGKVSSLNSYLTTPEQVATVRTGDGFPNWVGTLPSPDFDGSYGKNDDGVFFFTTDGAYVEWKGEYLWSDKPLKLTQQPELIYEISEKAAPSEAPAQ